MRSIEAGVEMRDAGALLPLTATQQMKRANILLRKPYPSASTDARPQVTRQASAQALAVVVNLGQKLVTLIAALGFVFRHW
jgi:hypothetical protein